MGSVRSADFASAAFGNGNRQLNKVAVLTHLVGACETCETASLNIQKHGAATALFSIKKTPKFTMQKEDSLSHQKCRHTHGILNVDEIKK